MTIENNPNSTAFDGVPIPSEGEVGSLSDKEPSSKSDEPKRKLSLEEINEEAELKEKEEAAKKKAAEKKEAEEKKASEKKADAPVSSEKEPQKKEASQEKQEDPKSEPSKQAPKVEDDKKPSEPSVPPKVKVKVDGKEEEIDIEELKTRYQKSRAAELRMHDVANQKKQIEEFWRLLKTNPAQAIQKMGLDPLQFAEETIANKIKWETMTPEQQEALQNKVKLRQYEDTIQQQQKTQKEAQIQKARSENEKVLGNALEEVGLKKNPWTISKAAYYLVQAQKLGVAGMTPQVAAQLVKEDFTNHSLEMFGGMTAEDLIKTLGAENVDKIRKHTVQQYKANVQNPIPPSSPEEAEGSAKKRKEKKKMTTAEFREWNEEEASKL